MTEKQYRTRKKWDWKVIIAYVPFPDEKTRRRSYEFYADSIVNRIMNRQKLLQENQYKGIEKLTE
jgi:hypothetical protein